MDRSTHNTYVTGPRREDVQRTTGRSVPIYKVAPRSQAGASRVNGQAVSVYRPRIENNGKAENAAPRGAKAISHPIVNPSRTTRTPQDNNRSKAGAPVQNNELQAMPVAPQRSNGNIRKAPEPRRPPASRAPQRQVQQPQRVQTPARQAEPVESPKRRVAPSRMQKEQDRSAQQAPQRAASIQRK